MQKAVRAAAGEVFVFSHGMGLDTGAQSHHTYPSEMFLEPAECSPSCMRHIQHARNRHEGDLIVLDTCTGQFKANPRACECDRHNSWRTSSLINATRKLGKLLTRQQIWQGPE